MAAVQKCSGQPFLGMSFGIGKNDVNANIEFASPSTFLSKGSFDSVTGATDLYPIANLAWASGNNNWMTYITGDIPVGAYDPNRLANIGIGHGAVDGGVGYTYLDQKTGHEFSIVGGLTYNFTNSDTDYQNGIDSHIDFAASQFLSEHWLVGIAGYGYFQLTPDNYPTNGVEGALRQKVLGSFESSVVALGPEVGYIFNVSNHPAYLNVRAYKEFWASNRPEGYALFANFNIALGNK